MLKWHRLQPVLPTLRKNSALVEQELSHGRVFGQADGAVVGVCSLAGLAEALQEMSANRPVGLISSHSVLIHRIQNGQSCFGSVGFSNRGGVSGPRAERRRYAKQLFVEEHDRRPIGPASAGTLSVYGLDGSFELKAAGAAALKSFSQITFRFLYQRKRPLFGVLLGKGNVSAVGPSSRGPTCFAMEHES